jgi:hypothetical protein
MTIWLDSPDRDNGALWIKDDHILSLERILNSITPDNGKGFRFLNLPKKKLFIDLSHYQICLPSMVSNIPWSLTVDFTA